MRPQAACYTCYHKWPTSILGRTMNGQGVRITEDTCPNCGSKVIGVSRGRGDKASRPTGEGSQPTAGVE